jgi:hypothetical protein
MTAKKYKIGMQTVTHNFLTKIFVQQYGLDRNSISNH